jgi:hypothetical protein
MDPQYSDRRYHRPPDDYNNNTFGYAHYDNVDLVAELDTIKQTMVCLAIGCYVNAMLTFCILL